MLLMFVAWISLGVIMFDMSQHYVGQFRGQDGTLSSIELDRMARDQGYCDWDQLVYYTITLEMV